MKGKARQSPSPQAKACPDRFEGFLWGCEVLSKLCQLSTPSSRVIYFQGNVFTSAIRHGCDNAALQPAQSCLVLVSFPLLSLQFAWLSHQLVPLIFLQCEIKAINSCAGAASLLLLE